MGQEPENTPQEGQESTPAPAETTPEPKSESKVFDADYVKELRSEAARYRTEAQEAKTKAQEYEDRDKSETEKLTGKLSSVTNENQSLKDENLRLRVALEKSIPADLIDRLRGKNKEELEADADKLLALVGKTEEGPKDPDFDGGPRDPAPDPKSPEEQHNQDVLKLLGLTT